MLYSDSLILKEINLLGINIINEEVFDIVKEDKFIINNKYKCDKVILSTGGITMPKTGSDGFGYKILSKLGHTLIDPKPALVGLKTDENVKDWAGIRTQVKVSIYDNDNLMYTQEGEAQLTEYGISGICVMNLSRYVSNNNYLIINFIPGIDNPMNFIDERNNKLKNRTIIELLEMLVNYKLLYFILKKSHINSDTKWDSLSNQDKIKLVNNLTNYKLNIIGTRGLEYGESTKGGIPLNEVTKNCESKIIPNLYITGELLNIDGICGGYNLTNAFITGILAGEAND